MPRSLAIAALLAGGLALTGCGSGDEPAADSTATVTATESASAPAPAASARAGSVTFKGVTVANPTDLKVKPEATSTGGSAPSALEYKDLVVGTGKAANPTTTVNVQYEGITYPDGKAFDASWDRGAPTSFSLTGVVPGFTQGIGGTQGVPPMKVGGRRLMILPSALGYPEGTPDGSIPPNTPIVFVVDLLGVS